MVNQQFSLAIHVITALAYAESAQLNSSQLAASIKTNPVVIRRLLSKLKKAGLIKSYRGKSGGVVLAYKPQLMTLDKVYKAVLDEPILKSSKKPAMKECPVSCSMKEILGEVITGFEKASLDYLKKITLGDITGKVLKNS